jgi:hypothetical protein
MNVGGVGKVSEVHADSVFTVDSEDGGSMYLRKVGNIVHCPHVVTTKETDSISVA